MKVDGTHREEVISLIREFEDVFAWGPEDMPGVDPEVAMHLLHDLMFSPSSKESEPSATKRIWRYEPRLKPY
ncbi:hypothetical protein LIER_35812 [Lithospermum erythrorhizon]|uniref:Uncharacterized protein n=1 Tax=Lithospermum erythrorhizon TaxID=34254 RepID=A0AAV3NWN3_LITER